MFGTEVNWFLIPVQVELVQSKGIKGCSVSFGQFCVGKAGFCLFVSGLESDMT